MSQQCHRGVLQNINASEIKSAFKGTSLPSPAVVSKCCHFVRDRPFYEAQGEINVNISPQDGGMCQMWSN